MIVAHDAAAALSGLKQHTAPVEGSVSAEKTVESTLLTLIAASLPCYGVFYLLSAVTDGLLLDSS